MTEHVESLESYVARLNRPGPLNRHVDFVLGRGVDSYEPPTRFGVSWVKSHGLDHILWIIDTTTDDGMGGYDVIAAVKEGTPSALLVRTRLPEFSHRPLMR